MNFDVCSTSGKRLYIGGEYILIRDYKDGSKKVVTKGSRLVYTGNKSIDGYEFKYIDGNIEIYNPEKYFELYDSVDNKKRAGSIIEGIRSKREIDELFRGIEEDVLDLYSDEVEEYRIEEIDEASTVTFGKNTYPKFGWAVVLGGGPGSGKGYTLSHHLAIDAKVFDVDRLKELYVNIVKHKKDSNISKTADKTEFDFKNPDDVSYIHDKIDKKGYLKKSENAFYKDSEAKKEYGRLTNVIYDITGSKAEKLMNIGKMLKDLGYKTSFVWVVTNRQVAMLRNLSRSRTVSQEILHDVHNKVNKNVFPYLRSSDAKYYDEVWVVFGSSDSIKSMTPEEYRELESDCVIKLEKSGNSFIIPEKVVDRVMKVLGPEEEDPINPKTYKDMEEVKKVLEPYKSVKKTKNKYGEEIYIDSYSDKNTKYDGVSLIK